MLHQQFNKKILKYFPCCVKKMDTLVLRNKHTWAHTSISEAYVVIFVILLALFYISLIKTYIFGILNVLLILIQNS